MKLSKTKVFLTSAYLVRNNSTIWSIIFLFGTSISKIGVREGGRGRGQPPPPRLKVMRANLDLSGKFENNRANQPEKEDRFF